MLWIVHYQWFRWSLIVVSVALSGSVLTNTIWSAIRTDSNKLVALGLAGAVLLAHSGLAVGIKVGAGPSHSARRSSTSTR